MTGRGTSRRADPIRTCVGCRKSATTTGLVRLVRSPEGELLVDHPHKLGGRGAWVCASKRCVSKAVAGRKLGQCLGGPVSAPDSAVMLTLISERVASRVAGLLAAARRARKIAVGATETEAALRRGGAALVVLASDVSPRVRRSIERAAGGSHAVSVMDFGDRGRLGDAMARSEVGAIALTDVGFGSAVSRELELLRGLGSATELATTTSPGKGEDEGLERAT